jgi:hypothetical protein
MDPLTICGFAFNVGSVKRHLVWKSQSFWSQQCCLI